MGRPFLYDELQARFSSWPPLRPSQLRRESESEVVVLSRWLLTWRFQTEVQHGV